MYNKYSTQTDKNSLSVQMNRISQEIYNEWKHQKERQEDREYCIQEVLKRLNIQIVNNASPAIESIVEQINKMLK